MALYSIVSNGVCATLIGYDRDGVKCQGEEMLSSFLKEFNHTLSRAVDSLWGYDQIALLRHELRLESANMNRQMRYLQRCVLETNDVKDILFVERQKDGVARTFRRIGKIATQHECNVPRKGSGKRHLAKIIYMCESMIHAMKRRPLVRPNKHRHLSDIIRFSRRPECVPLGKDLLVIE